MPQTFLTDAKDLAWLFETALAPYAGKVARPVVALLHGNEDSPEKVELFASNNTGDTPYAVFELGSDGILRETSDLVEYGIARAYFASAWADKQNEDPDGMNLSGVEIFDVLPDELPTEASEAASELAHALCQCNGVSTLAELYQRAIRLPKRFQADRKFAPELFGHYLGMEGMGHGVGLDSFGIESIDGGIVRTGATLEKVGTEDTLAVPYLGSILL